MFPSCHKSDNNVLVKRSVFCLPLPPMFEILIVIFIAQRVLQCMLVLRNWFYIETIMLQLMSFVQWFRKDCHCVVTGEGDHKNRLWSGKKYWLQREQSLWWYNNVQHGGEFMIMLYEDDKRETNILPRWIKVNKIKGVLCVSGYSMNPCCGKEDGSVWRIEKWKICRHTHVPYLE